MLLLQLRQGVTKATDALLMTGADNGGDDDGRRLAT